MSVCIEEQVIDVEDICKIAADVLNQPVITPNDNLFELGLNSILVIKLIGKIKKLTDIEEIPVTIFYKEPTPENFANYLNTINL